MEIRRSALVEYPVEAMFDLIEAAEHYPAFLPWCADATILARDDTLVLANLTVAWHGVRFELKTRNPKRRPEWLAFRVEEGPFRRFDGEWNLRALAPSACKVEFSLRYEFAGVLLRKAAGVAFDRIAATYVDAFVRRADALFGSGAGRGATSPGPVRDDNVR